MRHGAILVGLLGLTACETARRGTEQTMRVISTPPGAACTVTLNNVPVASVAATPGEIRFDKGAGDLVVACALAGYVANQTRVAAVGTVSAGIGIFVLGDFVDMASGANYRYPDQVTVVLTRMGEAPAPVPLSGARLR